MSDAQTIGVIHQNSPIMIVSVIITDTNTDISARIIVSTDISRFPAGTVIISTIMLMDITTVPGVDIPASWQIDVP